jgi:predicted RNase H-like HicB family nuclease
MTFEFNIIIDKDQTGFRAICPEIPGSHAEGRSLDEVLEHLGASLDSYWGNLGTDDRDVLSGEEIEPGTIKV